ncbi:MAG: carbohydrate binding domain-containing protein [Candidatus Limnocylindrales bacterium]
MPPRAAGWRALEPEVVAIVAGAIVWGVIGVALLAGGRPGPSGVVPSATSPSSTPSSVAVATLDGGLIELIRSSHRKLALQRQQLESAVGAASIDTAEVTGIVRQINSTVTFISDVADRIATQPRGAAVAAALRESYDAILNACADVLGRSLANADGIRAGSLQIVELLGALPDVDDLLAAAAPSPIPSTPPASATPTPTGAPSPVATPNVTARPSPTPQRTPSDAPGPSGSAGPSPTVEPNLVVNPGFEAGLAPWRYVLGAGAAGAYTITGQEPRSGDNAAQLTLSSGAGPWSAASLRQGSLRLTNGATVRVSLWARSTGPRNIRLRITTSLGEIIASRILPVDATWRQVSFDVTPIGSVEDAVLMIEVGQSDEPVWVDDVGLG